MSFDLSSIFFILIAIMALQPLLMGRWYAMRRAQEFGRLKRSTTAGLSLWPGVENPDGWDMIPGARGCSPQACTFRDHYAELKALHVDHLFGLSTQDLEYQREAVERLNLPFPILSDENLELARAMNLPTFQAEGMTLLKRLTLIIDAGEVVHVFYPSDARIRTVLRA